MDEHVQRFETDQGARSYRLTLILFPELSGFVHIVLFDDFCILLDVGSGFGESNEQLEQGLEIVRLKYGERVGMRIGRMEFVRVPGLCPGQIIARLDGVLLSADHVLETTSPHQAPESLSLSPGLNHYLESLVKVLAFAGQVKLTLGGHEGPVHDLDARIREIAGVHHDRLMELLKLTEDACTIGDISEKLFPTVEGYHRLLAIEETGALVEYLHQRGFLAVDNYEEVEHRNGAPIRFRKAETNDLERLEISFSSFGQFVHEYIRPARSM